MNWFDAAVLAAVTLLAFLGYRAGLLRSLADILGFIIAAPLALAIAARVDSSASATATSATGRGSFVFFGLLLIGGILFAQLLRFAIADLAGHDVHWWDRSAGVLLGIVRALLVAATIVLVFDRIIPRGRDPDFLKGSKVRPMLSLAAQRGLQSLPPEVAAYIDRLKKDQGL
jgi:membrane protein required for colicin V production